MFRCGFDAAALAPADEGAGPEPNFWPLPGGFDGSERQFPMVRGRQEVARGGEGADWLECVGIPRQDIGDSSNGFPIAER